MNFQNFKTTSPPAMLFIIISKYMQKMQVHLRNPSTNTFRNEKLFGWSTSLMFDSTWRGNYDSWLEKGHYWWLEKWTFHEISFNSGVISRFRYSDRTPPPPMVLDLKPRLKPRFTVGHWLRKNKYKSVQLHNLVSPNLEIFKIWTYEGRPLD